MKAISLIAAILLIQCQIGWTQDYEISKVKRVKNQLTFYFINSTDSFTHVPVLKHRRLDKGNFYLSPVYYSLSSDTLHLLISDQVNENVNRLILRDGNGVSSAMLLYNDKSLMAKQQYKSSIKIRGLKSLQIIHWNHKTISTEFSIYLTVNYHRCFRTRQIFTAGTGSSATKK